jgi:hypothetical protein
MQRLPTVVAQDGDGALVAVSVQQLLLPAIIAEQNLWILNVDHLI